MPNLAFVGCGHIHTPNFRKRVLEHDQINCKAVWDHDAARAKMNAEELGCDVAGSVEAIAGDGDIQAVVVCSETNRHLDLVMPIVEAGKHVFVEKPLGFTAEDAKQIASAIEKAGVIFQTGYFMRGNPVYHFVRQQIQAGAFGQITRARMSNCHSGSLKGWFDTEWRWMADVEQSGCGGFGDLGTHVLDILLWFFGEVDQCTAQIKQVTDRYPHCDETGEGLIAFKNGVTATLAAGWLDVDNPLSLLVSGTEGHAAVFKGKLYFKSEHVEGADGEQPWTQLPEAWPHAFELFLDAVTGKKDLPLVGAQEAAYRNAVMEAMYAGAKEGKWVKV